MNDRHFISKKLLIIIAIVWLALPLVIFLTTWIRPIIGWPMAIGVVWASARTITGVKSPSDVIVYVDRKFLIMAVLVFLFTVFSGIGGLAYQDHWDHGFRNAVFNDLVHHPWPVTEIKEGKIELLCYYLAFWLPAAVAAKLSGSMLIGDMVQLLYAFIGFMMIAVFVFNIIGARKIKFWVLILVALFCGWDIVTFFISSPDLVQTLSVKQIYLTLKDMPFWCMSAPALPSLSLFIYNQGIASWVALGLLYDQRADIRRLLFLYSLIFLFAPIPAAGLLPAMAYWMCKHLKVAFSGENLVGVFVFVIIGLYFLANNRTDGFDAVYPTFWEYFWKILVFTFMSYVIYLPYIWKYVHKNAFFWILFVTAIVVPYFTLNGRTDLGARIGIPLTYSFMVLVIKSMLEMRQWPRYKAVALVVTLMIGMVSSSGLYCSNLVMNYRSYVGGTPFRQDWIPTTFDEEVCSLKENFVARGESVFTKYLMKQ